MSRPLPGHRVQLDVKFIEPLPGSRSGTISLAKHNLSLPKRGWGELHIERAEPYAGKEWTDSGRNRDQRPIKQRARGEVRLVPCPPPPTALLHAHIQEFEVQPDGRLFVGDATAASCPR